jgi:hypothetical protein
MRIAAGSIILKYGQHHQVIATLKEFALHHNLKQNQKYTTSSFARHFKYKEHKDHYLVVKHIVHYAEEEDYVCSFEDGFVYLLEPYGCRLIREPNQYTYTLDPMLL